jgi:acetyl esterase/lipase
MKKIIIVALILIIVILLTVVLRLHYDNVPNTISKEAQETLKVLYLARLFSKSTPKVNDKKGWKKLWDANEKLLTKDYQKIIEKENVIVTSKKIGGVNVLDIIPKDVTNNNRLIIYTHGGSFTALSAYSTIFASAKMANVTRTRVISIDYTLAPFANWREIQQQVLDVYKELLESGYSMDDIGMFGDSAGGGLTLSTVLNLRELGWGMPKAVLLISPWADLSGEGDTYESLKRSEPVLNYKKSLLNSAKAYSDGLDLKDPRVSPLFRDYSEGFPPTLIVEGTKDIFLSTIVRLYQKMKEEGVDVTLDIYEGMWHVFTAFDLPETEMAFKNFAKFWNIHLK